LRVVTTVALCAIMFSSAAPALAVGNQTTSANQAAAVPSAPLGVRVKGTFTGIDLTWSLPADEGTADGVTGFVVHRVVNGVETAYPVARASSSTFVWLDTERLTGATYAVAAVNAEGEGSTSAPIQADPTSTAITVANTVQQGDGSTRTFLGQIAAQGAMQVVPLATTGATQQVGPHIAVSANGRQVAFAPGQTSLWTISAVAPHAVPMKILDGSTGIWKMSWSPDGTRIAFERLQSDGSSCVEIIGATGGTPVRVGCGMSGPTWLPDNQTLIAKNQRSGLLQRVQARANGAVLTTYAGTELARDPAVSPNGLWIAYLKGTAAAMIPIDGGTPQVGDSAGISAESLSWAPNTSGLLLNRRTAEGGSRLFVVPVSPDGYLRRSSAYLFDAPAGQLIDSAVWQGSRVTIKPTAPIIGPNLSVPFDLTGLATPVYVTCKLDGVDTSPCTSPFRQAGVAAGAHVLRVSAVEAGGRGTHTVRYLTVDATAPSVMVTAPPNPLLGTGLTLRWTGTDTEGSGIDRYELRTRYASPYGGFSGYVYPTSWQSLRTTSLAMTLAQGYTYCYSMRARDQAGNIGPWSSERCTTSVLDDRALAVSSGVTRGTSTAYTYNTYSRATATGKTFTRTGVQARRVAVVVTTCSTCGSIDVWHAGVYLGRVSLVNTATRAKQVRWLPLGTVKTGTLTIRTVNARTTYIDGVVIQH
jgi:WD40-like Beta Propeller Repeat